jgi:phospholipid/cholesterol/gamma-HCH transport system substrate-binding protein
MDERIVRFRVGVMVLATLIITGILTLLFGDLPALLQGTYTVHLKFRDAPGVGESTPVRKSGILIGRVTHVDFTDDQQVLVTVSIDGNRPLQHNEVPYVRTSLLGDAMVQFEPQDAPELPKDPIRPGETIQGATARDPLQVLRNLEPRLDEMMKSVTTTSDELGRTAQKLNRVLDTNEGQLDRVLTQTQRTLQTVEKAMTSADKLLGDEEFQNNLRKGMEELPQTLRDARETINGFQQTLELANRNFRNLEGFTEPLGRRGDELFSKLDRSAGKAEQLLERLVDFADAINNQQGSLGRLTNDPQLYNNLNQAAKNVEELTRQLRPILNDVRVFTDKISRDPGRLGVRGVFQQGTGIK